MKNISINYMNNKLYIVIKVTILLFSLFIFTSNSYADQLNGNVTKVFDGDSFAMEVGKKEYNIRIYGIDAPEKEQPYNIKSRDNLESICLKKTVKVEKLYIDSYDRVVGFVECDGVDAGERQVRDGYAWVYKSHISKDRRSKELSHYFEYEGRAKGNGDGMWGARNQNHIPPWKWRQMPDKAKNSYLEKNANYYNDNNRGNDRKNYNNQRYKNRKEY